MSLKRKSTALLSAGVLALGLVACADESDDGGNGADAGGAGGGETIRMGYLPSWSDGLSMAYLLDNRLTEMGYEVEHVEISEAALLYQGLANGDIDMYPSAWPEATHIEYAEEYQEDYESLGSYYDSAELNLSVPEYMDIDSIPELQDQADRFDGQIVGIEPGAGLTRATQEDVIPGYGLDGYELTTSSTTAMLTELENAIQNEDDIVVSLWTPFWANGSFPVKALEDPEDFFPEPESLHFLARTGFSEEFPDLSEFVGDIQIGDEDYSELEDLVVNQYEEGQEPEAIQEWLDNHPDLLPALPDTAGE